MRLDPSFSLKRIGLIALLTTLASVAAPAIAAAQALNINLGSGAGLTERVVQLIGLMTVLSLAPSIVIMTTAFVRIVVVLSLLRTAMGLQQSPPNAVIVSLALFLTAIVMAPTYEAAYEAGIKPLMDQQMSLTEPLMPHQPRSRPSCSVRSTTKTLACSFACPRSTSLRPAPTRLCTC